MKYIILFAGAVSFFSCSIQKKFARISENTILADSALNHAHVGISLFDPGTSKYLYNYQAKQYFIPASNVKIATCYAAMKYLEDSLVGIRYLEDDTALYIIPSGDPTLLHGDFEKQPVIDFLKATNKNIYAVDNIWKDDHFANGWAWNAYNSAYSAERSPMPVYGNVIRWIQERQEIENPNPDAFNNPVSVFSIPDVNWKVRFNPDTSRTTFSVNRSRDENVFIITQGTEKRKQQDVPFVTKGIESALELLVDTIGKKILRSNKTLPISSAKVIRSQLLDSLLRPMMYNSDNFMAEQTVLMVSQELLGFMQDSRAIDTVLKKDLPGLPNKPRWVDGSGLSRFNLFTPEDFIVLLNKMKNEFGMDRIKNIFPTGGTGTLEGLYTKEKGKIFAKTGTLSDVIALSGFLYTKKDRLLIFSIIVNNHYTNSNAVRSQIEKFLLAIRDKY